MPDGYNPEDSRVYHTVYLLDANYYFDGTHERIGAGGIAGTIDRMVVEGKINDVILVGIGNLNTHGTQMRGLDFHSEKTEDFLKFITDDLIPTIDQRFKTDTNISTGRALLGHSSAAYFTMFSFFKYDSANFNPFHNFIALSLHTPSFPVDLMDEESLFYERQEPSKNVNMKLFLGVGSLEEQRFLDGFYAMKDSLNSRQYNLFNFESKIYIDHGHSSYIQQAVEDALVFTFP